MPPDKSPQAYLDQTLSALETGDRGSVLDDLPLPVYTTDENGLVTYWNRACVDFAGREPQLGRDRWCVTWQLYTMTGEPLPHEQCPMARAIQEQRCIRNAVAIAQRPDGSRRAFNPYPTPLFNPQGKFKGAVNMLIDVTDQQSEALAQQACRCRRLADATYDRGTAELLASMAEAYERTAAGLEQRPASA